MKARHQSTSCALGLGSLTLGDCLAVVPELGLSRGRGFDLIYVDPPFNAGGARGARKASGLRAEGKVAYKDSWGGLEPFLKMLEPRLAALRDALAENGSLWLHLDHRGVHDAKVLADRIFGRSSFRGEIIWVPGNGSRRRQGPGITHQTILIYSKKADFIWNADHPELREAYAETSLQMHFQRTDKHGRHYRERVIGGKRYRYYADVGRRLGSVWSDCPAMRANTPLNKEATGYPTQKPEKLLERIVLAASQPGGAVLDPMCGSGTTLVAAEKLKRDWAGVDKSPVAYEVARARLEGRINPRSSSRARKKA